MTVIGHDGQHAVPMPADLYTDEQWATYFDLLSQGIGPDLAARDLGSTGSRIRSLIRRDPAYIKRFDEARSEGSQHYEDRLRAQARLRALAKDNPSDRMLEVELATHGGADYQHLRRDRVKMEHSGRIEGGITIVLDPGKLSGRSPDELREIRAALETLAALEVGEVVAEQKAIEAG